MDKLSRLPLDSRKSNKQYTHKVTLVWLVWILISLLFKRDSFKMDICSPWLRLHPLRPPCIFLCLYDSFTDILVCDVLRLVVCMCLFEVPVFLPTDSPSILAVTTQHMSTMKMDYPTVGGGEGIDWERGREREKYLAQGKKVNILSK